MSRLKLCLICIFSALAMSSYVYAHSGATGVVKERMDAMGEIAKSMKIIGAMVKGQAEFDPEAVSKAASAIAQHADTMLALFPEDTISPPSEARPEIWQNWEEFSEITKRMSASANLLSQNMSSLDELKPHFGKLAKTCSSCHEKFRLKK